MKNGNDIQSFEELMKKEHMRRLCQSRAFDIYLGLLGHDKGGVGYEHEVSFVEQVHNGRKDSVNI